MYKFSNENTVSTSYMVYEVEENATLDSVAMGMLSNNNIPGIANTVFIQMNTTRYIKYNVTSKISVSEFFSGRVNSKRLIGVLSGIVETMMSLEEYMLDYKMLVLDLDRIFVSVATNETMMLYIPIMPDCDSAINTAEFFRNIVFTKDRKFDVDENSNYLAQLNNYLNNTSGFSLRGFKAVLDNIASDNSSSHVSRKISTQTPVPQKETVADSSHTVSGSASSESNTKNDSDIKIISIADADKKSSGGKKKGLLGGFHNRDKKNETSVINSDENAENGGSDLSMGFEIPGMTSSPFKKSAPATDAAPDSDETSAKNSPPLRDTDTSDRPAPISDVYGESPSLDNIMDMNAPSGWNEKDDEGTVVMDTNTPSKTTLPYLIRRSNGERIEIGFSPFRLGRNSDFNSYNINNYFVGHSHCHIITRGGNCYVVDDNSQNHTFIDNNMLSPGIEYPISHGQILRLASEEFDFKQY